ncbi:MAG: DUF192 domain-containing protein [Halobacteriaceae archaeon]
MTVRDADTGEALAVVRARVADTPEERYAGLSDAERLPAGTGMLFVFRSEGRRAFVMRRMAFPLDIVFVGADGRVTTVRHAPVPPPDADEADLVRYTGRAKWVLEVPRGWADRHGVAAGDRVSVTYANRTVSPGNQPFLAHG